MKILLASNIDYSKANRWELKLVTILKYKQKYGMTVHFYGCYFKWCDDEFSL